MKMMMMKMMRALRPQVKPVGCRVLCYLGEVECFIQQDNDGKMSSQTANNTNGVHFLSPLTPPILCVSSGPASRHQRHQVRPCCFPTVAQSGVCVSESTNFMVKQMDRNDGSSNPAHWLTECLSEWVCVMQWPLQVGTLTLCSPHHAQRLSLGHCEIQSVSRWITQTQWIPRSMPLLPTRTCDH